MEYYVAIYLKNRSDKTLSAQAAYEFMRASYLGYSSHRNNLVKRFVGAFSNSRHLWMWDEPSLSDAFIKSGFKQVRRCHYGDWADSRFASVEKESNYLTNNEFHAIGIEGYK